MVKYLGEEFDVEVTRFSIRRALKKDAGWSKKVTQNVAKEQNANLRNDYIYKLYKYRSDQLVYIDESGIDRGIETRRRGYTTRGKRPR